jgi:hypothetical protein
LLDRFDETSDGQPAIRLQAVANAYLREQEQAGRLDWRYYLVKYPAMRSRASGIYAAATATMGFDLCMLNMTQLNSYYRDPYLETVLAQCDAGTRKALADSRFYGREHYRAKDRWLTLQDSGERLISCSQAGFQLRAPQDPAALAVFEGLCHGHEVRPDLLLAVPQSRDGDQVCDHEDRIRKCARLLTELAAGLRASFAPQQKGLRGRAFPDRWPSPGRGGGGVGGGGAAGAPPPHSIKGPPLGCSTSRPSRARRPGRPHRCP